MGGGRLRRPPFIKLSILYEKNKEYMQRHTKNMQIHINICKNVEKYIKKNSYAAAAALPRFLVVGKNVANRTKKQTRKIKE